MGLGMIQIRPSYRQWHDVVMKILFLATLAIALGSASAQTAPDGTTVLFDDLAWIGRTPWLDGSGDVADIVFATHVQFRTKP